MSAEIERVLGFVGAGVMALAILVILEATLRGVVARWSAPADRHSHRVGTQLPRIPA